MKTIIVFAVAIIVIILIAIDNANLRMENVDHVREHTRLVHRVSDISDKNEALKQERHDATEKYEAEIGVKDIRIERLAQAVIELYQAIRNAPKNRDRET